MCYESVQKYTLGLSQKIFIFCKMQRHPIRYNIYLLNPPDLWQRSHLRAEKLNFIHPLTDIYLEAVIKIL